MLIIGITGTLGAGKGTIADYLVKSKHFLHLSVREFLTKEIKKRKLPVSRNSMVVVGNDLRKKYGGDYIVRELYKIAKSSGCSSVIESIRSPLEIESLKRLPQFYLFAVDAKPLVRYERNLKRGSVTDYQTYEEFLADEKKEMNSTDPTKQNLSKCALMADYKFDNNGTKEDLYEKVDKVIEKIG
jgi:dephospho-CoA kinase